MVWVRPGEVAGEGDRRAELAERAGPAEHRAGRDARADQRQRHPAERRSSRARPASRPPPRTAVGGPQRALDREHEEGHGDERLGEDDRRRGERERDAERGRASCPSSPRRPRTSSSATPPTTGGSTSGTVTSAAQPPAREAGRASSQASGTPRSSRQPWRVAVTSESRRACSTRPGRALRAARHGARRAARPAAAAGTAARPTRARQQHRRPLASAPPAWGSRSGQAKPPCEHAPAVVDIT